MTREDLIAEMSAEVFRIFPPALTDNDLVMEDLQLFRQRVNGVLDQAEMRVVMDAQLTAEDVVDDIAQQSLDERR